MYRIVLILFISICCCNTGLLAQGTTVSGTITTGKNKPVAYATATLLKQDSSVVNGAVSDDNGRFELKAATGKYILRISGLGFETKTIPGISIDRGQPVKKLGIITVDASTQVMKEVKIISERPMMEMGIDKKVFNVDKNITAVGGSASDVLQNVPSVSVDVDGNVSLRGKSNVNILIDGKPATLLGGDAASALQSLPASSIDQVEVMTNPSAKYDASGLTGIINIITKKEKKFGTNGTVTLGAGDRDKYNGNLNLNVKNEKWNIYLNSSFRQNQRYRRNTTNTTNKLNPGLSYNYEDNLRIFNGFFNSLGAEYNIDTNNSITLTQNINKMYFGGKGTTYYSQYADESDLLTRRVRNSVTGGGPFSSSSGLAYKHKYKVPDRELSASSTFVRSWMKRKQDYTTNVFDANNDLMSGPVYQRAPGESKNSSLNSRIDYTSPLFTENGKIEAGLRSQMFWLHSLNSPVRDSAGQKQSVDSVLLNGYDYTRQIYAAYTSWSDHVGKFRYQTGLRLEYAYYHGTATSVQGKYYHNKFLNLFPSVFLSYELPASQSVYLSYTRRINRPRFYRLLPYVDLSNPQDTSQGNPALIPEFIRNVELSYNKMYEKGHNIIISGYYQYTKNLITKYKKVYGDGTSYTQRRNLAAGVTYGLELTGQVQLVKKVWDVMLNTNFFRNEIFGTNIDPSIDNSGFSWMGKLNSTLKLPADFSLQVNGNYRSPKIVAQGRRKEVYWIDVALRKSLWDGKANLVLNVSDIFNTRKYTTNYDFLNNWQSSYNDRETRIGRISFTYRFGNTDRKGFGSRKKSDYTPKKTSTPATNKDRDKIKDKEDDGGGGF